MATITTVPTYLSSKDEHAVVFAREDGDQVNLSVMHTEPFGPFPVSVLIPTGDPDHPYETGTVQFGCDTPIHQLSLVVFDNDPDESNKREEINLNFAEARLLRDLLNNPAVVTILSQDEPTLAHCSYCGQMHNADLVEHCPLKK